jgi:hypothetical protein
MGEESTGSYFKLILFKRIMKDRVDREDEIGLLMREEGLLSPSPGFTERVMLLVEESRQKADMGYKPLINRKTWLIIVLIMAGMSLVTIFGIASNNPGKLGYLDKIRPATDFLAGIHVPMHAYNGTLMLAALIMASVGSLLFLDLLLSTRFREFFK